MRHLILVILAITLILPGPAIDAKKKGKGIHPQKIVVYDAPIPEHVDGLFAAFNDILSSDREIHATPSDSPCPSRAKKGTIAICAVHPNDIPGYAGQVSMKNTILIADDYWESTTVWCHELMHVLARIGDAYDSEPNSCVHGSKNYPTDYDAELLLSAPKKFKGYRPASNR